VRPKCPGCHKPMNLVGINDVKLIDAYIPYAIVRVYVTYYCHEYKVSEGRDLFSVVEVKG